MILVSPDYSVDVKSQATPDYVLITKQKYSSVSGRRVRLGYRSLSFEEQDMIILT